MKNLLLLLLLGCGESPTADQPTTTWKYTITVWHGDGRWAQWECNDYILQDGNVFISATSTGSTVYLASQIVEIEVNK